MRGVGGSKVLTQLLVANYEPVTKALEADCEIDDWSDEPAGQQSPFDAVGHAHQGPRPERRALRARHRTRARGGRRAGRHLLRGEIRRAAHRFMEEFEASGSCIGSG